MSEKNFPTALAFVWQISFDSPRQGTHTEAGDPGGQTRGGVIATTWADAVRMDIVTGALTNATDLQLSAVLRWKCWGALCDALPVGLDLLVFNGKMMSGRYPWLVQQCLGLIGPAEVDGKIGPQSLATIRTREPETFVDALTGAHAAYLATLPTFKQFGTGWLNRLRQARTAAMVLVDAEPSA